MIYRLYISSSLQTLCIMCGGLAFPKPEAVIWFGFGLFFFGTCVRSLNELTRHSDSPSVDVGEDDLFSESIEAEERGDGSIVSEPDFGRSETLGVLSPAGDTVGPREGDFID